MVSGEGGAKSASTTVSLAVPPAGSWLLATRGGGIHPAVTESTTTTTIPAMVCPCIVRTSLLRTRRGGTGINPDQSRERAVADHPGDKRHRSQRQRDPRADSGETSNGPDPDQQNSHYDAYRSFDSSDITAHGDTSFRLITERAPVFLPLRVRHLQVNGFTFMVARCFRLRASA